MRPGRPRGPLPGRGGGSRAPVWALTFEGFDFWKPAVVAGLAAGRPLMGPLAGSGRGEGGEGGVGVRGGVGVGAETWRWCEQE